MPHYIAFLRGINLGKRRLKMAELRAHFEALKFRNVSTFIASGNVVFETKATAPAKLETEIERHLEKSLGYKVDTFVRTRAEVAAAIGVPAFPDAEPTSPETTIHVHFLKGPLAPEAARKLGEIRTDVDAFHVNGREFYWLCRIRTNESKVWTLPELRALKLPTATARNLNMLRRLAAEFPATAT